MRKHRKIVEEYLLDRGVKRDKCNFRQVNTDEEERSVYNENGKYTGSEFEAYRLSQVVQIDSKDLDLIISISRDRRTSRGGLEIRSLQPKFYYNDLDKLKLNFIEQARKR